MRERRLRRQRELLVLAAQHAEQRGGSRRAPRARCPRPTRTPARRRRAACARAAPRSPPRRPSRPSASLHQVVQLARDPRALVGHRAGRAGLAVVLGGRAPCPRSAWLSFTRARTSRPSSIGPPTTIVGHEEEVTSAARWMVEPDRDRRRDDEHGEAGMELSALGVGAERVAEDQRREERPDEVRVDRAAQALEHGQDREGDRDRDHRRPPAHGERAGEREERGARDQQVAAGRVDEQQLDLHLHAERERQEQRPGQPVDEPWHANAIRRREGSWGGIPSRRLPPPGAEGRVPPRIPVKVLYEIAVMGVGAVLMAAAPAAARPAPQVRVDQLGYAPGEAKVALPARAARAAERALPRHGRRGPDRAARPRRQEPGARGTGATAPSSRSTSARCARPAATACGCGARARRASGSPTPAAALLRPSRSSRPQRDGAYVSGPSATPPATATTPTRTVYAGRHLRRARQRRDPRPLAEGDRRPGRRSPAAGSTPATSSSSPTRPPTRPRCC